MQRDEVCGGNHDKDTRNAPQRPAEDAQPRTRQRSAASSAGAESISLSDGTVFEPAGPKEKQKDPEKERVRREMYEGQRDVHGVFKPGPCAKLEAAKMQEQTRCEHPVEDLKWGGTTRACTLRVPAAA